MTKRTVVKPMWLCPTCGMLTEGKGKHKTAVGNDCYWVMARGGLWKLSLGDKPKAKRKDGPR